jgi:DNA-binding NtrC family response regulator
MITGYATIDTAVGAAREGAYDYLARLFALGQLKVVLNADSRSRGARRSQNKLVQAYQDVMRMPV